MRYTLIIVVACGLLSCDRGCYMPPDQKSKDIKYNLHKRYPEYKPYKK